MTYAELCAEFLPRPIHSEEQFAATQQRIDQVIDSFGLRPEPPTEDEQDYLGILGLVVMEWEELSGITKQIEGPREGSVILRNKEEIRTYLQQITEEIEQEV